MARSKLASLTWNARARGGSAGRSRSGSSKCAAGPGSRGGVFFGLGRAGGLGGGVGAEGLGGRPDAPEAHRGHPVAGLEQRQEIAPADDPAEDAVQVVEAVDLAEGEEELRAVGVGAAVGHGEDAGAVVPQAGHELVGQQVAGPALPGAERIAALHDKVGHDAVEGEPGEKRDARLRAEGALGEAREIGDGQRRLLVEQLGGEDAARRDELRVEPVGQVPGRGRLNRAAGGAGGEQGEERAEGSHGGERLGRWGRRDNETRRATGRRRNIWFRPPVKPATVPP